MGLIGSLIGGAASIFGGIASSRAARKSRKLINSQLEDNENWYERRYNEDGTERADAQRMITKSRDALLRANRAAAGAQAVGGATTESVAAQKQASAEALADTMSGIAADATARKDEIEDSYLNRKASLTNKKASNYMSQAEAIGKAAQALRASVGN